MINLNFGLFMNNFNFYLFDLFFSIKHNRNMEVKFLCFDIIDKTERSFFGFRKVHFGFGNYHYKIDFLFICIFSKSIFKKKRLNND